MPPLNTKEIKLQLPAVPSWSKRKQTISRTYTFEGFPEGVQFVVETARRAQKANHHPDINIRFNKVTLLLTSHDEGGLTEKDFAMAKQCDTLFSKLTE